MKIVLLIIIIFKLIIMNLGIICYNYDWNLNKTYTSNILSLWKTKYGEPDNVLALGPDEFLGDIRGWASYPTNKYVEREKWSIIDQILKRKLIRSISRIFFPISMSSEESSPREMSSPRFSRNSSPREMSSPRFSRNSSPREMSSPRFSRNSSPRSTFPRFGDYSKLISKCTHVIIFFSGHFPYDELLELYDTTNLIYQLHKE